MQKIVILGAGGFAREVFWHLRGSIYSDFVFVDDVTPTTELLLNGRVYPVVKNWKFYGLDKFIVGIGSPKAKKIMTEKALQSGLKPAPTFVHPRAFVQDARIGVGGIISPNCMITTNVTIGDFVVLNLSCTVGHDAILNDFVTANPGCHISGNVKIGEYTTLGTGTAVREEVSIVSDVITGAQSAVVSDLKEPGVYVGVPAKILKKVL